MALAPFINITELCWGGSHTFGGTYKQWLCFVREEWRLMASQINLRGATALSNSKHYQLSVMIDFIMCDKWCLVSLKFLSSFFHPFCTWSHKAASKDLAVFKTKRKHSQKSFPLIHIVYLGFVKLRLTFLLSQNPTCLLAYPSKDFIRSPVGSTVQRPSFSPVDDEDIK